MQKLQAGKWCFRQLARFKKSVIINLVQTIFPIFVSYLKKVYDIKLSTTNTLHISGLRIANYFYKTPKAVGVECACGFFCKKTTNTIVQI